jgi:sRNA-binding protein
MLSYHQEYNSKQDHDQVIELLAFCYPKAFFPNSQWFFPNPQCRLPLKAGIFKDIDPQEIREAAGHPVNVLAAVKWYEGHIGYLIQMQTGAPRYDLNGNRVGTVTQDDAQAAKQRLEEIYKRKRERDEQQGPVEIVRKNGNGRMNNEALPAFITKPVMAKPEPPTLVVAKPEPPPAAALIEDDRNKQLQLAIKRIELASTNLADAECAATILRTANEAIQRVIDKLAIQ